MSTLRKAAQQALTQTPCDIAEDGVCEVIDCCRNPKQADPVDQTVMELAESVGLIGPASRAHDLHGAIQRFHDLIVMNASIKAAQQFAETLAQQAEPVAWIDLLKVAEEIVKAKPLWKRFIDGTPLANDIPAWMADFASEHYTSPPAPKQAEPVDNEAALRLAIAQRDWAFKQLRAVAVASAEPVAPPQRKPLTDEEISRIYVRSATHAAFARAIERAHGIGGDDGQA